MIILKVIALFLALYAFYDVTRTLYTLFKHRKLLKLALKHQKKDSAKVVFDIIANTFAIIIFMIFTFYKG